MNLQNVHKEKAESLKDHIWNLLHIAGEEFLPQGQRTPLQAEHLHLE